MPIGHGWVASPTYTALTVTNSSNLHNLKLYTEQQPAVALGGSARPAIGSLSEVLNAFRQATGWSLRYQAGPEPRRRGESSWTAPIASGTGAATGHLRLERSDAAAGPLATELTGAVSAESAREMASAVAGMLGELLQTRHALWLREAELAAGVPLVPHAEEKKHLAVRLEAVLRGGAEAVGCQAAALYLLDDATSMLKLRSCWGLPMDRLAAAARPLKGAVADLEALLGHAVVLEDTEALRHWRVPEEFPSAVCVPVSTPTTLLGTLWFFSAASRDFDDHQTNILEVVAGRVAAELEREMLLRETVDTGELKKQAAAAERLQRNQLPTIAPLLDGWDIAGWTAQAHGLGGDFYDWFCLPDGLLGIAAGHALGRGMEAALTAGSMKAALRAHAQYYREAYQVLKRTNLTLWTTSAGDQHGTLFYGLIETATGRLNFASAGHPGAIVFRAAGHESLSHATPLVGEGPESAYEPFGYEIQPGEVLVLFSEGVRDVVVGHGRSFGEAGLLDVLAGKLDQPADRLADLVRRRLEADCPGPAGRDRTVLVIKRRPAASA